jgi:hypothetical protein
MTATLKSFKINLDRLGEWAVADAMKINPDKCKPLSLARSWLEDPLSSLCGDKRIPEAISCKYLVIIVRSDLSWADKVMQYKKPGRHFVS